MRLKRCLIIVALILADQLSKIAIKASLEVGESVPVIGNFFKLSHINNYGAALSMFQNDTLVLILIPVIAMIVATWYLERHRDAHWSLALAIELIVAGGIGNLIDRVTQGYVTDFLDFTADIPFWDWIFNVADIAVCVGCFLLVLYLFFFDKPEEKADGES